jgi:hypothetical protein
MQLRRHKGRTLWPSCTNSAANCRQIMPSSHQHPGAGFGRSSPDGPRQGKKLINHLSTPTATGSTGGNRTPLGRPMTWRSIPHHPQLACHALWSVIQPRSGRATPRCARAAGPSRSAALARRQSSPSSQHRQGGTGERSCWLRWDPPEGRRRCQRPSRPAGAGRRGAAGEPARHKDLVGGYSPSSRVLVPGHHLGAIALADALDQCPPLGKLLGRGRWRLDRRGRRLAHAASVSAIHLVLSSSAQLRRRCGGQTSQPPRKGVLRISVQFLIAVINCRTASVRSMTATVIEGTKLSGWFARVCMVGLRQDCAR